MNETTQKMEALITGYGDEGAKMLAAAYIADRFDHFEDWMRGQDFTSPSIKRLFQDWMRDVSIYSCEG